MRASLPPAGLPRLNEDVWFDVHQELLLAMVNTKFGRHLLQVPDGHPEIILFRKECVHWMNPDGSRGAEFRTGSRWADVIRAQWDAFCSFSRYFRAPRVLLSTMDVEIPQSALTRYARSVTASSITAYPDADPETTTVDGWIGSYNKATWTLSRDAASGSIVDDSAIEVRCESLLSGGTYYTARAAALFNTASIGAPAGGTTFNLVSAVLSLYVVSKNNVDTSRIQIGSFAPASNTALALGDFSSFGTTSFGSVTIAALTTGQYNDWTLNASGLAAIQVSGVTKLGWRTGRDLDNAAPTGNSNDTYTRGAEQAGTTSDPRLVVTYFFPPAAPSGLSATAANGSQVITLNWTDNSSNEDGFTVEVSADGATGWTTAGTVGAGVTTLQHNVAAYSTRRYYRVKATNATQGDSSVSANADATTAPAAPSGLSVTPASDSNVLSLAWTDNSSDETNWRVERSSNGTTGWAEIATSPVAAAVITTDNVGARDALRYYRVRAYRAADGIYSAYSAIDSDTTAPANPSAMTAVVTGGIPRISWTDNSSTESTFCIERKISGGVYAEIGTSTGSPFDDLEPLTVDDVYYYRVRAKRASDTIYSAYATEQSLRIPPEAPTNLQASCAVAAAAASRVELQWDIVSAVETGFLIERADDGITFATVTEVAAGVRDYVDTGLAIDTEYLYRISAKGPSSYSAPCTAVAVTTSAAIASSLNLAFRKKAGLSPE